MRMHSVFRRGSHFVVLYKFVYTHTSIIFFFFFFVLKLVYKRRTRKRKTSRWLMSIHTCRPSVINSKIGWCTQRPICVCVYIESIQSHWAASVGRGARKKYWCVTRLFIKISNHKHTLSSFIHLCYLSWWCLSFFLFNTEEKNSSLSLLGTISFFFLASTREKGRAWSLFRS
jgi:hypothetical protein